MQAKQYSVPVICITVNSEVTLQLLIDFCIILFYTMLILILAVILTLRKQCHTNSCSGNVPSILIHFIKTHFN